MTRKENRELTLTYQTSLNFKQHTGFFLFLPILILTPICSMTEMNRDIESEVYLLRQKNLELKKSLNESEDKSRKSVYVMAKYR